MGRRERRIGKLAQFAPHRNGSNTGCSSELDIFVSNLICGFGGHFFGTYEVRAAPDCSLHFGGHWESLQVNKMFSRKHVFVPNLRENCENVSPCQITPYLIHWNEKKEILLVSEKCLKPLIFDAVFCFTELDMLKRFFELDMHVFWHRNLNEQNCFFN